MPKRMRRTFSSRGVSVLRTFRVCSARFMLMTASAGDTTLLSSMKSPRCESSSSPMGVSRLIGDGARDGLPDPPRRVGAELVPALVLELVDRLHEADVALLDQVQELQAAVRVLLRDADDEAQVRLDE